MSFFGHETSSFKKGLLTHQGGSQNWKNYDWGNVRGKSNDWGIVHGSILSLGMKGFKQKNGWENEKTDWCKCLGLPHTGYGPAHVWLKQSSAICYTLHSYKEATTSVSWRKESIDHTPWCATQHPATELNK